MSFLSRRCLCCGGRDSAGAVWLRHPGVLPRLHWPRIPSLLRTRLVNHCTYVYNSRAIKIVGRSIIAIKALHLRRLSWSQYVDYIANTSFTITVPCLEVDNICNPQRQATPIGGPQFIFLGSEDNFHAVQLYGTTGMCKKILQPRPYYTVRQWRNQTVMYSITHECMSDWFFLSTEGYCLQGNPILPKCSDLGKCHYRRSC